MEENTSIVTQENTNQDVAEEKQISFIKKLFSPKNLKKKISVLVAIVLIIGIALSVLIYLSPGNVAKRFVVAEEYGDISKIIPMMAYDKKEHQLWYYSQDNEESLFEFLSDEYDSKITNWNDLGKCIKSSNIEYLEDYYGDYKITAETTRVKHISIKKLKAEVVRNFHNNYGFDIDTVTDAKEVTVKYKIKGEDETDRVTYIVWIVKIGGFWKVLDYDYDWE